MTRLMPVVLVLVLMGNRLVAQEKYALPARVEVLPLFFVPADREPPSAGQLDALARHVQWSSDFYASHLPGRATFTIANREPVAVHGRHGLNHYRQRPESGVPDMVGELLDVFDCTRFDCPYVFVSVWMNPEDRFPVGGGRPINGGFNTGGGIVVLSSYALDRMPMFQSTLRHELGHAFGLPHIDVYGYDMDSSASIMSYRQSHWTNGFDESDDPGQFSPEDLRGLSLNGRAFPELAARLLDLAGYFSPASFPVWLGPMSVTGHPDGRPQAATASGETFGSSVSNAVDGIVRPNRGPGITFDATTMWSSGETETGWVDLVVTFPMDVALDGVVVHSEHSGRYHRARALEVAAGTDDGWRAVYEGELMGPDESVRFNTTRAHQWRFLFRAGPSGVVVIREIEFFAGNDPIFPLLVPLVR